MGDPHLQVDITLTRCDGKGFVWAPVWEFGPLPKTSTILNDHTKLRIQKGQNWTHIGHTANGGFVPRENVHMKLSQVFPFPDNPNASRYLIMRHFYNLKTP